jgi:transposase InsO family protein
MSASSLVKCLKKSFATHGVPKILLSDNGTNYVSQEFSDFASEWGFQHVTSSPLYPKGNGKAEATVKIAKTLMKKCKHDKSDFYLALLQLRNSPNTPHKFSPVQRLMSRRTRSNFPVTTQLLTPAITPSAEVIECIYGRKQQSKVHYDKTAKTLPELEIGQ